MLYCVPFRAFGKEQKSNSLCHSFCKEQKSDLLLVARLKSAKKHFALCRSGEKSNLLFVALLIKSKRANCSFRTFGKEQKSKSLLFTLFEKNQRVKSERAIAQPCKKTSFDNNFLFKGTTNINQKQLLIHFVPLYER